jgi:hypothetical protein
MCFSPCFVYATREALVQQRLLQCQTCGSQAFHVLDCCRHPDYVKVSTSSLGKWLKTWLGGVRSTVRAWSFQRRQRRDQPLSPPETLDSWETRPLSISRFGDLYAPRETGPDKAAEEVEHETVPAQR